MGVLDSMENAIAHIEGKVGTIDLAKIEAIVEAILAAAPAIEQGLASTAPYVEAIVTMVKTGGNPSDEDWATLNAALDSGSAQLAAAAQQASSEIATPGDSAPTPQE